MRSQCLNAIGAQNINNMKLKSSILKKPKGQIIIFGPGLS